MASPTVIAYGEPTDVLDGVPTFVKATCPFGTTLTGGGLRDDISPGSARLPLIVSSYPDASAKTWIVKLGALSAGFGGITATAYAVCLPVG